uniref:Ig-like domain-containing protein n=1 Tax=Poecilia mexicana TaxID=48701 RepID=A0A3B3XDV2_9TELE
MHSERQRGQTCQPYAPLFFYYVQKEVLLTAALMPHFTTYRGRSVVLERKMKMMIVFGIILHMSRQTSAGAESVLLPFRVPTDRLGGDTVEWRRSYPEPVIKVHVFQNSSDQPGEQDWLWRSRTKMDEDPLKTGDLSLTLKHPTKRDSGMYGCFILRQGKLLRAKTFNLKVKVQQVEVDSGKEFVLLPCRTTDHLPADARVETRMDEDLLKTGDLSLTLRDPALAGTYTCRVYSRDGEILMEEKVKLLFRHQQLLHNLCCKSAYCIPFLCCHRFIEHSPLKKMLLLFITLW